MKVNNVINNVKKKPLRSSKKAIFFVLALVSFTVISLLLRDHWLFSSIQSQKVSGIGIALQQKCDIFRGHWVKYPKGPYYTNSSKCEIDNRQNCMKFGRPDTEFMHWRWKPEECELPLFDATRFLELVRGKSMAFIGDSVGRNQLESLMCLLTSEGHSVDETITQNAMKSWLYRDYNFTLALIWSPNLVKASVGSQSGYTQIGLLNLYLDKPDDAWTDRVQNFDYLIISAGQWFSRPLIYNENGKVLGCNGCKSTEIPDISRYYGYRMALRTTFRTIMSLPGFKGVTILRTFSPTHFGTEKWDKGNCTMTRPFTQEELRFDVHNFEFYLTQMDEFGAAEREGRKRGLKFSLMDVTEAMGLRPDGHPSHYGHPQNEKEIISDCLHWCLPGPIDLWNEFLLHMLKIEDQESIGIG